MTPFLTRFLFLAAVAAGLAGCSAESKRARALERAGDAYRAGDLARAQLEYQAVLQSFPEDPTANERLALIWFDRGATLRALSHLSKMVTLSRDNLGLRLKRAQLIATLGHTGEARREALALLGQSTGPAEALVLLTECVRDAEDFKAVEQVLQKHADKGTVSYQIASANLLMLKGDAAQAKAALTRAIALDPKSAAAHSALAAWLATQNQPEAARAEHVAAVGLAPLRSSIRLKQATFLVQNGSAKEAVAALTDLARQAPDYQPAGRALAQIALLEQRHDDALSLLQTNLTRDAADYESLILRARVWLARGETKRAIAEFERIGGEFKGLGGEKYHLALAYLQDQDPANAIVALEQSVAQFPDNLEAVLALGQLQLRAGKPDAAAAAMVGLIQQRPALLQPYLVLIEAAKALGKLEELGRGFRDSLAREPKNAQLHHLLGLVYVLQDKPVEARQSFGRALDAAPEAVQPVVELFNLDLRAGDTAGAEARARALVAKTPPPAVGHLLLARVLAAQRRWPETEAAAVAAIDLDAAQAGAHELLAESLLARKDQPGTAARLETFLARRPADLRAVMVGGQVFTQLGQFAKARDTYEKFLAQQPGNGAVLNNLAHLYAGPLNQPEHSLALARQARDADPTSPQIADTLGWFLHRQKQDREALPHLEEAARKLPGNPEVNYHLGLVRRALGQNEAALTALRAAEAAPGDFPGREELRRQRLELEQAASKSAPAPGGAR